MKTLSLLGLGLVAAAAGCAPTGPTMPAVLADKGSYCAAVSEKLDAEGYFPETPIQYLLLGTMKDGKIDKAAYSAAAKKVHVYANQLAASADIPTIDDCVKAFPVTDTAKVVQLPPDGNDKLFGCDGLLEGLATSMGTGDPPYLDRSKTYDPMAIAFGDDMAKALKSQHMTVQQGTDLRDKLLPQMLNLGNSTKVLQTCHAAFPQKA